MTGRTHIAVGVAAALAVTQPTTVATCVAAVLGGAVGGLAPDIDTRKSPAAKASRGAWAALAVIAVACLALDWFTADGLWAYLEQHLGAEQAVAVAVFVGACLAGSLTDHRSFAHSALAGAILTAALGVACAPLAKPFAVGFVSHIVLDLLNHQRVRVLYPLGRGFALGLCDSGGTVDRALFALGVLTDGALLVAALAQVLPALG